MSGGLIQVIKPFTDSDTSMTDEDMTAGLKRKCVCKTRGDPSLETLLEYLNLLDLLTK